MDIEIPARWSTSRIFRPKNGVYSQKEFKRLRELLSVTSDPNKVKVFEVARQIDNSIDTLFPQNKRYLLPRHMRDYVFPNGELDYHLFDNENHRTYDNFLDVYLEHIKSYYIAKMQYFENFKQLLKTKDADAFLSTWIRQTGRKLNDEIVISYLEKLFLLDIRASENKEKKLLLEGKMTIRQLYKQRETKINVSNAEYDKRKEIAIIEVTEALRKLRGYKGAFRADLISRQIGYEIKDKPSYSWAKKQVEIGGHLFLAANTESLVIEMIKFVADENEEIGLFINEEIEKIFNKKMAAKCSNFRYKTEGYSIKDYKNKLESEISNYEEVLAQSEKYQNSPKLECKTNSVTLQNGEKVKGVWKIVSAYDILPSHDPYSFGDSKGFPLNKSGGNVNDRNYSKDVVAQAFVKRVAADFDGRAIEEPIRVTRDGIVVDGNNRTMSRIIAHKQGTDNEYLEAMYEFAQEKCICIDDIKQILAPTMVFELIQEPTYNRAYFALFNKNSKKEKDKGDTLVTLISTVPQSVRNVLNNEFDLHENLSDVYADRRAVLGIKNILIQANVIQESELNKYFDQRNNLFTDEGKTLIQRIVLSGILDEANVRLLEIPGLRQISEKLIFATIPITANQLQGEFSLKKELNEAILLLNTARSSGLSIADAVNQGSLFGDDNDVVVDFETLAVAIFLTKGKMQFKNVIKIYNQAAKESQGVSIFGESEKRTKRQILQQTIGWLKDRGILEKSQEAALNRLNESVAQTRSTGRTDTKTLISERIKRLSSLISVVEGGKRDLIVTRIKRLNQMASML